MVIFATGFFFSSSVVAVLLSLGAEVIVAGENGGTKVILDAMIASFGEHSKRITSV